MTKKVVIKPAISQKFQEFLKNERILFFSAPCGFGKTVVAQALLEGSRVWKLEGESARGTDLQTKKDWEILLMEDFQLFQEEEDQQALCALIRRSPGKRFVILSRGSPPGCLMAFQYAGLMTVIGPKGEFRDVAVLGPERGEGQVEISLTDARALGIDAPVRLSGDIQNTPGAELVGERGQVRLLRGVIAAKRHIHLTSQAARRFGVKHGQSVKLRTLTERPVIFEDVSIRVSDKFAPYAHLDYDEANACGFRKGDLGRIVQ